jgi:hypothetical protein
MHVQRRRVERHVWRELIRGYETQRMAYRQRLVDQREAHTGGPWVLREAAGAEDAGELASRLVQIVLRTVDQSRHPRHQYCIHSTLNGSQFTPGETLIAYSLQPKLYARSRRIHSGAMAPSTVPAEWSRISLRLSVEIARLTVSVCCSPQAL